MRFSLRWFDDVHLNGGEVAGVVGSALIEGRIDYAIVRIGLNVNTRFDEAPADVQARAISLREVAGRDLLATIGAECAAGELWPAL